jgi:hypothetical protein
MDKEFLIDLGMNNINIIIIKLNWEQQINLVTRQLETWFGQNWIFFSNKMDLDDPVDQSATRLIRLNSNKIQLCQKLIQ